MVRHTPFLVIADNLINECCKRAQTSESPLCDLGDARVVALVFALFELGEK